jgi:hypothetical protein
MTMEITQTPPFLAQAVQRSGQVKGQVLPKRAEGDPEPSLAPEQTTLTPVEKEFFASVFPASAKEIRQHVVYQKNGIQQPALVGSVVDRKG